MRAQGDELPGVAALADRPVDGRRVAIVMGVLALALSIACAAQIEHLLATADREPEGARLLRAHPARTTPGPRLTDRLAVVLVDGMRADEAGRLAAWRALAPRAVTGELALSTPTLSRPFYHQLFTGAPHSASGVRSNRFEERARLDSLADRVRAAGGSVAFVAEGLDWMRRMHGRPGDAGSDARASIDDLDAHLAAFRAASAPALLIVHVTSTDSTAHAEGVASDAHRRALERADRAVARVARDVDAVVVLADHGHLAAGGHGGPEPEVARAPLLVRAPGLEGRHLEAPVDPTRLAATFAAWLGVEAPRAAVGAPEPALLPAGVEPVGEREHARLASLAAQGRAESRLALVERQRWVVLLAALAILMALGPIKRAYGFDRSVPVAILLFPLFAVGLHLALGRPLTLSAIDLRLTHGLRVALLGAGAALLAFAAARALATGPEARARTRRAAASVGFSALACALAANASVGFALGPWPLSPHQTYLALYASGAGAAALAPMGAILLASAWRERAAVTRARDARRIEPS